MAYGDFMIPIKTALVLEDTDDVRQWLMNLLLRAYSGIDVTAVSTLTQGREAIESSTFDIALIDINLPDGSGIELVHALRVRATSTLCVMATTFDDDENILNALRAGAHGYLLKGEAEQKLIDRLVGILNGEPPLSPSIARRMLNYFSCPFDNLPSDSTLTEREQEILTLVAKGLSRTEIGALLNISFRTVATHIGAIYRKLNIGSRSEATIEAVRRGFMQL
jgi:DNA-binding NarL/FixJ family response regulator